MDKEEFQRRMIEHEMWKMKRIQEMQERQMKRIRANVIIGAIGTAGLGFALIAFSWIVLLMN